MKEIKVGGKFGKFYFSNCPNCKKHIVHIKEDIITCSDCRGKYEVRYPESKEK